MKTECVCLGPVSDTERTSADIDNHKFGNLFANSNTTTDGITFGNPFAEAAKQTGSKLTPQEYLLELQSLAMQAQSDKAKAATSKKRSKSPAKRNTTKRLPRNATISGSLSGYKVSEVALTREFSQLVENLKKLGLKTDEMPKILIVKGAKPGWRKAWFGSRVYVVSMPERGGRTKFKSAYREALACCFLEELRRQDIRKYRRVLASASGVFGRAKSVRKALVALIQYGPDEAFKRFDGASGSGGGFKSAKGGPDKATLRALCDYY